MVQTLISLPRPTTYRMQKIAFKTSCSTSGDQENTRFSFDITKTKKLYMNTPATATMTDFWEQQ
jgi:hypothetical protein